MHTRPLAVLTAAAGVLLLGVWIAHPPASRANGEKDDDKGGHAHVPAPL